MDFKGLNNKDSSRVFHSGCKHIKYNVDYPVGFVPSEPRMGEIRID